MINPEYSTVNEYEPRINIFYYNNILLKWITSEIIHITDIKVHLSGKESICISDDLKNEILIKTFEG